MQQPAPLAVFPRNTEFNDLATQVNGDHHAGYYGPFDANELLTYATSVISSHSDAKKGPLSTVLEDFFKSVHEDCLPKETGHSCWLSIRITLPTDAWVVPRWHTDGRMFNCTCSEPKMPHSKYAITLLGPSTRIKHPSVSLAAALQKLPWDQSDPDPELVKRLSLYEDVAVRQGQIIRFSWGEEDSPVHSEPDLTDLHRVFVSILTGSESEIREMCHIRGENYGTWY